MLINRFVFFPLLLGWILIIKNFSSHPLLSYTVFFQWVAIVLYVEFIYNCLSFPSLCVFFFYLMSGQLMEDQIQVAKNYKTCFKQANYIRSEKSLYVHCTDHIKMSGNAWHNELVKDRKKWGFLLCCLWKSKLYYCFII